MPYPEAFETFSREENVTYDAQGNPIGGTILDAVKQNAVYALLEALQLRVGFQQDAPSPTGSLTAQVRALQAAAGATAGIVVQAEPPGTPNPNTLWFDSDEPAGQRSLRFYDPAGMVWRPIGANATAIGGVPVDAAAQAPDATTYLGYDPTTQTIRWRPLPSAGLPFAAPGDLVVGGPDGTPTRLGVGTEGQVLAVVGGLPQWRTPPYLVLPAGLQQGDLFYVDATLQVRRLPAGTPQQFLKTLGPGADPVWSDLPAAPPGSAIPAPSGAQAGDLLVFDGTNWTRLPLGPANTFLRAPGPGNGLPGWAAPPTGMPNPMTAAGDLIYGDVNGAPLRRAIGQAGQVLTVVGGAPAWVTPAWIPQPASPQAEDLLVYRGGAWVRLPVGSNGQVLGVVSNQVAWAAPPPAGHVILDETTALPQRSRLAFVGSAITATDDAANDRTVVTVTGGSGGGHTIEDEGTALPPRSRLNFTGAGVTVTDDAANDRTVVSIPGGGGGGSTTLYLGPPFQRPQLADFPVQLNVDGGTAADSATGIVLARGGGPPGGENRLRGVFRALPAPPYEVYAYLQLAVRFPQNYLQAGLALRNSSDGRVLAFTLVALSGGAPKVWVRRWTTVDTDAGLSNTHDEWWHGPLELWLRLTDDGSTRTLWVSPDDGQHWVFVHSHAHDYWTIPDQVGFVLCKGGSDFDLTAVLRHFSFTAPAPPPSGEVPLTSLAVVPHARVRQTVAQSVPSGQFTALQWDTVLADTAGLVQLGTQPTRVTVPRAGVYAVSASVLLEAGGGQTRYLGVRRNGTQMVAEAQVPAPATANAVTLSCATSVALAAGDYVEAVVYHDVGSAVATSFRPGITAHTPHLAVTYCGRAS